MALVEIRDVYKSFQRDTQRIDVFSGITLDVGGGSFLALMGPSGSGKSTLLNLIAGLDKPTSGTIRVAGADVSAMTSGQLAAWRARHVGFVFQQFNLLPVLTAYQNVELPLLLTAVQARARRARQARVRRRRPRRPDGPLSAPALRRSGAARQHRARDRRRPDGDSARRAHRPARRQELTGSARPPAAPQPGIPEDHRHRHARRARGRARDDGAGPREG